MIWIVSSSLVIILDDVRFRNVVIDVISSNTVKWLVLFEPSNDLFVSDNLRVLDEIVVMLVHRHAVLIPLLNELLLC